MDGVVVELGHPVVGPTTQDSNPGLAQKYVIHWLTLHQIHPDAAGPKQVLLAKKKIHGCQANLQDFSSPGEALLPLMKLTTLYKRMLTNETFSEVILTHLKWKICYINAVNNVRWY